MSAAGKIQLDGVNIDYKSREVLFSIVASEGESNTSELREVTGFGPEIIKYRFEKLRSAGLVEVGNPERKPSGRMGPTPVTVTGKGEQVAKNGFPGKNEGETLADRLSRLERRSERYEDLREEYHRMRKEKNELEGRVEKLEERVEKLEDWISLGSEKEQ